MPHAILDGLSLVDVSGYVIIGSIVAVLLLSVVANVLIRARYASMERELTANRAADQPFEHPVLNRIVADVREASRRRPGEVNTQAIVEDDFQSHLKGLLLGERFTRSATGLVLILGLSGTFYGLTLSIGKLARLMSEDAAAVADVTQALTAGLTQALSGMSVAFSGSLFGIVSAVVLTILGIVSNVTDRRTAIMIQIETYLEHGLAEQSGAEYGTMDAMAAVAPAKLDRIVTSFGQSVARLEEVVTHFDAALQAFSTSTRDFKEFNLHLKDNVQRMSLSFGDFSEILKSQVGVLKSSDRS